MAIIDAAIVLKTILPNPLQDACRAALGDLMEEELIAPTLWTYETTSTVTKAVHFQQITREEGQAALRQLKDLKLRLIPPDPELTRRAFEWTLNLGRAAAYDSFYLALAERARQDLWTADAKLRNAADVAWVQLVK